MQQMAPAYLSPFPRFVETQRHRRRPTQARVHRLSPCIPAGVVCTIHQCFADRRCPILNGYCIHFLVSLKLYTIVTFHVK